jgi:dethiobiotin synthetase
VSPAFTPLRIVLVGTGTSVGKTWVGRALLRELVRRSIRTVGLKPIESGVENEAATDATALGMAGSIRPQTPPYRFAPPVSPHLAARRAGVPIELGQLLTYVQAHESASHTTRPEVVVVETAGGLFSPLSDALVNWDFARALDPSRWVLVAPDALGVLHDITATLEAMRARGRVPDEILLSAARMPDVTTGTNAAELERLGLARRPFTCAAGDSSAIVALADALLAPPQLTAS